MQDAQQPLEGGDSGECSDAQESTQDGDAKHFILEEPYDSRSNDAFAYAHLLKEPYALKPNDTAVNGDSDHGKELYGDHLPLQ